MSLLLLPGKEVAIFKLTYLLSISLTKFGKIQVKKKLFERRNFVLSVSFLVLMCFLYTFHLGKEDSLVLFYL